MSERTRAPLALEPRGLSREQAAAYCGMTPRGFDNWVKQGIVPGPIRGTQRFDRKALDAALDRHSGLTPALQMDEDPYDAWKRSLAGSA